MRVPTAIIKRGSGGLGRALAAALVLLAGFGEPAVLAVLPSDAGGAADASGQASLVFATAAPTPLGTTRLAPASSSGRAGAAYYRETSSRRAPGSAKAGFLPLYREAARSFGVSWRLIASIHRQETAFSTVQGTYHGLNAFGCCAGPMQFNVTNGPPSTWELYRDAFRLGKRPRSYPHPTRHHPSIYDDFDAIMAAAALLSDSGATNALDGASWSAAYAYYGHDLFGTEYASEVLGRAVGWERDGFCLNCAVDPALTAAFDDGYGADARRVLLADELRAKRAKAAAKKRKKQRAAARARKRAAEAARERERAARPRVPERERTPPRSRTTPAPSPESTTTPAPPTTATEPPPQPEAPAPPAEPACTKVTRLLGCRD
jgi:signal transduction histidine kinase